ncbi:MAG TPA: hypothetical protein VMJ49_03095 [Gaiellaceae bacterium]|nr:hypothetical protein [Gaiellaceae bacterium]
MAATPVPHRGEQKDGTIVGVSAKTVTQAIGDAYNVARKYPKYQKGTQSFHIDDIWVVGTNPISEYVVKISSVPNG